jgi:hypothetical protein
LIEFSVAKSTSKKKAKKEVVEENEIVDKENEEVYDFNFLNFPKLNFLALQNLVRKRNQQRKRKKLKKSTRTVIRKMKLKCMKFYVLSIF